MKHSSFTRTFLAASAFGCCLAGSANAHPGSGIAVDERGSVYFLDTGSGLWRIDPRGRPQRLSPLRYHWMALDESGRLAGVDIPSGPAGEVAKIGRRPLALIASDWPIAVGGDGSFYYPSGGPGRVRINRIAPSGERSVLATLRSGVQHINGMAAGPASSVYYTDNTSVRRIDARGRITTIATIGAPREAPAIPGNESRPNLRGLAVDAGGTVYVADAADGRVLKIVPGGRITRILQTRSPWSPTAVALSGRDIYVLEYLHTRAEDRRAWLPLVRKITPGGKSAVVMTVDRMRGAR